MKHFSIDEDTMNALMELISDAYVEACNIQDNGSVQFYSYLLGELENAKVIGNSVSLSKDEAIKMKKLERYLRMLQKGLQDPTNEANNKKRRKFAKDMLDGNKATTNDIWDFHYEGKDQLYTVWKGKKWFYGDCKSTTPIETASLATKVNSKIGHYANDKRNRFIGSYKDGGASFEGYWVQEKSGQECSSIVDGSRFYGKVWFKMVSEEKFEGRWGFCDTAPIFAWNGYQVAFTSDVTKTLSSKQQRVKIQKSLNFFGFNAGSPDGVFGIKTKTAIGELQTCWAGVDPSASTFPKTTEFGVLTPRQMQTLMETYDTAQKSYSKAN